MIQATKHSAHKQGASMKSFLPWEKHLALFFSHIGCGYEALRTQTRCKYEKLFTLRETPCIVFLPYWVWLWIFEVFKSSIMRLVQLLTFIKWRVRGGPGFWKSNNLVSIYPIWYPFNTKHKKKYPPHIDLNPKTPTTLAETEGKYCPMRMWLVHLLGCFVLVFCYERKDFNSGWV
jgi:hypothetical protein